MTMLSKIGNSQGIRIPKSIIKQAKLDNAEIEFEITKNGLLLKPIKKRNDRKNWEYEIEKVLKQNKNNKDDGIIEELLNIRDSLDEWEW